MRGKRIFDIVMASTALIVLSPVMALIWISVRLTSRGPAIYRGERVGLAGREFEILKFRTMWHEPSTQLTTSYNDPRVTPIGRFLRRAKFDELPQLINIVRGEMSIVGPRPEFRNWVDLYSDSELRILDVRPGLTDYASLEFIDLDQLVGESLADERYLSTTFAQKNALRLKYVDEMSWHSDLGLIWSTLRHVLHRVGGSRKREGR